MDKRIIVDAHEDIAWNKITLHRDFFESVRDKRAREGVSPAHGEGSALVGFTELLEGNVRIIFCTLYVAQSRPDRTELGKTYSTPQQAHDQAMDQLVYYMTLALDSRVSIIRSRTDMARITQATSPCIGLVILMEGADPIIIPEQTQEWWNAGVRIVGPAWSQTRYSGGTHAPGPLTDLGRELMTQLERSGLILDLSHMAEQSFYEALDLFGGEVIASHSNCRIYVNTDTDRQLSDEMIRAIIARNGVMGTVFYNRFLAKGWDKSIKKNAVTLANVVQNIQYICNLAGDTHHVGIGTDFDGGFGKESTPSEIDSIADLQKLGDVLSASSFSDLDIANIFSGNWIQVLQRALPE